MNAQVIGAGGWGLALARRLALNGHDVRLWCREEDNPDALRQTRLSPVFLPGVVLPESIDVSREIDADADLVVLAVPSHAMRNVAGQHAFSPKTILVSVAKGIENGSLLRMSQVIHEVSPGANVVSLSGPSHAEEVARKIPTAVVAASEDEPTARRAQKLFSGPLFRVYTSTDPLGVEIGGAVKNVIAIAVGASDGLGFGDNTRAALITRGLAEITRFGIALGACPGTFAGLSGVGDLIVTCTSRHSRNHSVGERLGRGEPIDAIVGSMKMVAEGVWNAKVIHTLARTYGVSMPITDNVYGLCYEKLSALTAVEALMTRDVKPE